jgi:23S rRNA (uracil1939-C5)-methyltransferase
MTPMADDTTFELELTGMAHGGSAVGRHKGRAIFIPYAIPGERVMARITQDKGRYANAEVVEVVAPSQSRVIPRCPHFGPGRCGGCHWQHMDYPAQLAFKQQVIADQLARIGGLRDVTVHPTIPSFDPWYYRSHVTFHVTDEGRLGFVATDNQTVIPIEECHIIRPELAAMFEAMKTQRFTPGERLRLQLGTDGSERMAAVVGEELPSPLPEGSQSSVVHYTVKGRRFQVSAGSFFQVNLPQAETLVDLVLDRLQLQGAERALDLYAGVGLFTAFLAEHAAHVTAVESYPPAVQDALANLNSFNNVEIMEGAVAEALDEVKGRCDAVVTDPPRAGMEREALDALVELNPAKMVYVSCDPATLARDAKRLSNNGYRLLDVQPVDMFPQTYHIEALATLVRV